MFVGTGRQPARKKRFATEDTEEIEVTERSVDMPP